MTESVVSNTSERKARPESEVRAAVRTIVLELSPTREDRADAATTLVDGLGYHSLSLTELAFTLEDEFDLPPIDEPTARAISTVGAVEEHVVAVLASRGEIVAPG